jgi:hypothetical protein
VVTVTPRSICLRYPVGQELCVSIPSVTIPDPSELLAQIFAQINAALAPLQPIFNIIDAVVAVFECVKAIPQAITELNPVPLIQCIPGLAEAINKLIAMIPLLSLPVFIVDLLDVIIFMLQELRRQFQQILDRLEAIARANLQAQAPGNVGLALTIDCINANFDADLVNLNEQVAPLNRLLGVIDLLLELSGLKSLLKQVGVDATPCLGNLDLDVLLTPIDLLIKLLTILRNLVPIPSMPFLVTEPFDNSIC